MQGSWGQKRVVAAPRARRHGDASERSAHEARRPRAPTQASAARGEKASSEGHGERPANAARARQRQGTLAWRTRARGTHARHRRRERRSHRRWRGTVDRDETARDRKRKMESDAVTLEAPRRRGEARRLPPGLTTVDDTLAGAARRRELSTLDLAKLHTALGGSAVRAGARHDPIAAFAHAPTATRAAQTSANSAPGRTSLSAATVSQRGGRRPTFAQELLQEYVSMRRLLRNCGAADRGRPSSEGASRLYADPA